jgi:acyl carrier protein
MLANKIIRLIADNYAGGETDEIDVDTPLLELNFIDSSSLFDLVHLLNREADVAIPFQEVTPTNFASVQAMLDLVGRLKCGTVTSESAFSHSRS